MCGITGIVNLDGEVVSPFILKKMTDAIAHRGPDGEGHWIEKNVGIGHRRLAIVDLTSAAHQPMISSDSRYIISYNGEIYNFFEIRKALEKKGYKFESQSDTEVVLNAFAHWGKNAFLKFNGMFAIALWDKKEKCLLLARDRYGIKPLYYAMQKNVFAFGSEQKAITAQPKFEQQLNKPALFEYFTFQNIFTDKTLLKDIRLLPAGHYAVLNLNKKHSYKLELVKYWDFHFSEPSHFISNEEYLEELDRLFKQAVKRQLIGDVEIGSYLSGGIDSGSIVAIAAKKNQYLKSFTCGFDLSSASFNEISFDERVRAEAMSTKFKTEHYEIVLKSGDMEQCLPKLVYHLEEPRIGQCYPNFFAAKLASKFVKVVLSGGGGDELFGGYPWRYYQTSGSQNFKNYIDNYYLYWQRLLNNTELKKVFSPISKDIESVWTRDIFESVFSNNQNSLASPEDYINHSLYFEAKTFLHGLFIVEDKLSMAHSMESRFPFMDNDLVNFAMQCPVRLKLNNFNNILRIDENELGNKKNKYLLKTNDGKKILRDFAKRYIPEDITSAAKQGFSGPDSSWFKGDSMDFVKKNLLHKDSIILDILDKSKIIEFIEEHFNGVKNRRLLIWSLLYVNIYLAQIKKN
jgi:asparagine synthase (glutamine-hydrolysing)